MANYTNVIASNICDAAGNKLASGTVSFQATDAANQPLNFQVGGGGQVVTTPATAAIVAGAIAGGFQVADSANTIPAGVLYRVTITDNTLNRIVVAYSLVTVTGTAFNLDTYTSTGASVLPPVGGSVNGPLTVVGDLSITGTFNPGALGAVLAKSVEGIHNVDGTFYAQTSAGIQAAHDDSVDGGEIYLPAGTYTVSGTITISKRITIRGAGWGTILQVGSGVGATTDVFLLKPSTTSDVQGVRFQDFCITPQSGTPGRSAFMVDGTNASVSNLVIDHVRVDALGGYAFSTQNVTGVNSAVNGTPYTTTIRDSILTGGLNLNTCGDSINLIGNTFVGARDITVNTVGAAGSNGGAHGFVAIFNNITVAGGVVIQNAWQGLFAYNNFESVVTNTGANNALLDIQGNASANVKNFKVIGNFLGANNLFVADTVRVDRATQTLILHNMAAQGSGTVFRFTTHADRTRFELNTLVPDNPITSFLADLGTNTSGEYVDQATGQETRYGVWAITNAANTQGCSITSAQIKASAVSGEIGFTSGDARSTALDAWLSRLGAGLISVDKTGFNVSDGGLVQTGGIDLGTAQHKRIRINRGTALVAGDFALSAGWGVGATVTSVVGTDQAWTCTVTAAGTPAANPTLTLTFHDGAWTSSLSPITVTKMTGGSGVVTQLTEAPTATTNVVTFNGTPVAASTYIISSVALGR